MWSFVISTVVYVAVYWAVTRWMDHALGWSRGRARWIIASLAGVLISSLSSWAIDTAFPSQKLGVELGAQMKGMFVDGQGTTNADADLESILTGKPSRPAIDPSK